MSTVRLVWDVIERMREDESIPWQVRSHLEDIRSFNEYADCRDAPKGIVADRGKNDSASIRNGNTKSFSPSATRMLGK